MNVGPYDSVTSDKVTFERIFTHNPPRSFSAINMATRAPGKLTPILFHISRLCSLILSFLTCGQIYFILLLTAGRYVYFVSIIRPSGAFD